MGVAAGGWAAEIGECLTTRALGAINHSLSPSEYWCCDSGLLICLSPPISPSSHHHRPAAPARRRPPHRPQLPHVCPQTACMNSLTFLSRQFDVLAAARTPPSTPVQEHSPLLDALDADTSAPIKRVQTWNKPLRPDEHAASSSTPGLKRSYSSPAEVHPADPASASAAPAHPRRPSVTVLPPPPLRRASVTLPENPIRPKSRSESVLHRRSSRILADGSL